LSGCDETARVSRTLRRKARKEHRCDECRELIAPGSTYEYVTMMGYDSSVWSEYTTCLSCVEIRMHFQCDGWLYGQLWDELETNFFPGMKAGGPCMEGLSPEAKTRLFERRLAWLGVTAERAERRG